MLLKDAHQSPSYSMLLLNSLLQAMAYPAQNYGGAKNCWGEILSIGDQRYFVWDTASQNIE